MNKKAQATAIVWFVAIFIILFASMVFLSGVVSLNKKGIIKKMLGFEDEKIIIADNTGTTITLQKNFQSFLNMKTEFEGEEITILELIENSDKQDSAAGDLFKQESSDFFNELIPARALPSYYFPYWIRVYDKDERITPLDKYARYFSYGTANCHPFTESSITLAHYTQNKKIALCIRKEDFNKLEAEKIV